MPFLAILLARVRVMEQYEIGQAWVSEATEAAPPLMSVIGAIDEVEDAAGIIQRILSIAVMPHPAAREKGWTTVLHMPVTETAFAASGLRLTKEDVELGGPFIRGYARWLKEFDAQKAGAIDVPVTDAYLKLIATATKQDNA